MTDYIKIGSTPTDESCAQIGSSDYEQRSSRELRAYINQLRRHLGPEVGSARLATRRFSHDFGSYREVVCYYNDGDEAAISYALRCECAGPTNWDQQALDEFIAY